MSFLVDPVTLWHSKTLGMRNPHGFGPESYLHDVCEERGFILQHRNHVGIMPVNIGTIRHVLTCKSNNCRTDTQLLGMNLYRDRVCFEAHHISIYSDIEDPRTDRECMEHYINVSQDKFALHEWARVMLKK